MRAKGIEQGGQPTAADHEKVRTAPTDVEADRVVIFQKYDSVY